MLALKKSLRNKFIKKRRAKNVKQIKFHFSQLFNFMKYKFHRKKIIIGGYYPSDFEVNIMSFLKEASDRDYQLTLPVIQKKNLMNFKFWKFHEVLKVNKYGIPEPDSFKKNIVPDLILVPLVAFDKNCNRLGYGAGFYDRYLKKVQRIKKNCSCIGIAYNFQKHNKIPINKFDYKLDNIFTEKGFLNSFK
tara:strand:- start:736 stop:1305 length:570 start_codon:yes stop_codon:yes gene_type:complete